MTIAEAIARTDVLHRNSFDNSQKIAWLSNADSMVQRLVLDAYEAPQQPFEGYSDDTDSQTELKMPPPFDEGYLHWLSAQIHLANQELDKYNNSILLFYSVGFDAYNKWYRRTHSMKQNTRFRF